MAERAVGAVIRHAPLANMFMFIILLSGVLSARSMLREAFPPVSLDMISVVIPYPGADVAEVEEGVSRKIEEAVDGLEGVDRYTTTSREGVAQAVVEFYDGYPMDKARSLVENAINSISTFPGDTEKPIISEILINREVLILTLWGDMDERTRKELAEEIKDELQADPAISQVSISGVRDYELVVEVSEEKLRAYGLSFAEVAEAVRRGSVNLSGGSLRTKSEQINIRTVGRKYTGEDLAEIVVLSRPGGDVITLDRIATIRDAFTEDPVIARFNGKPAVTLTLSKIEEEDTISIAKAGHAYAREKTKSLPEGIYLTSWSDGSLVIDDRLYLTFRNGAIGLCIVLLCLFAFLNSRLSFWVAMGIPISVCGSFAIMAAAGLTLNSITLFGLVMVIGIVVDDAIVVAEAIHLRRNLGDGPLTAATRGTMEVGLPVIAAVMTTIIAFLPLAFISGTMGKFMATMSVAVIGALVVSLVEALFILPAHLTHLPPPDNGNGSRNRFSRFGKSLRRRMDAGMDYVIAELYGRAIRWLLIRRYEVFTCGIGVIVVTFGLGISGHIKFTPFPQWDENQIVAVVEFPQGTSTEITSEAVRRTEAGLRRYIARIEETEGAGLVEEVLEIVGEGPGRGYNRGSHLGMVRVQLQHSNHRRIHSQDILAGWQREVGDLPGALSQTFSTIEGGPGGTPIEIWLQGNDTDVLRAIAEEIKEELRTYDGVYQIEDSFRPGKRELKIDIKREARPLGITLDELARQVYSGFYGVEADRIQRGRDDIRIKVRYPDDERSSLSKLEQTRIRTPQGLEVPFFSVANVEFGAGPATIERADGRRLIAVAAEVDESRANATEILGALRADFFPGLHERYSGFTLSLEGAQQSQRESNRSLLLMFPVAMLGIYVVITAIFRSYVQALIIMFTVPFGIVGAVLGHVALGWQIVMFSIFGMMALTGVVVNDAIVLIEAINRRIADGTPTLDAIAQGGVRRFRAILLTTLSTVGALFPTIIEDDLSAQPLNPMALSIAAGVAFATILTLVYIPCLFAILNDLRRMAHFLRYGVWPSREEVEPARMRNVDILAEEAAAADEAAK